MMERCRAGRRKLCSSRRLEGIEEDKPVKSGLSLSLPLPDTPVEPMEFLARSWSLSAMEVSKALTDAFHPGSADGNYKVSPRPSDADASVFPIASPSGVADQLLSDSVSIRAGSSDESYGGSPNFTGESLELKFYKSLLRGRVVGRWLKEQKEKRKEEHRAHSAQVHAATAVAGVAAAIAATAAVSSDEQRDPAKTTSAVASAAALVASYCVEIAESMGAHRDQILAVVDSAVNLRTSGDIMTLTAGAATALRGAAILRSRLQRGKGNASPTQSDKPMKEKESERLEISTPIHYVSRGGDLLKVTRKGVLHWKHVSVYMNLNSQVVVELMSRHMGGSFVKKKTSIVYDVCEDIPAWPGRKEEGSGEQKAYFGLETARGLIQFECKNKKEKEIWSQGVQQLLFCRGNENAAAYIYKERKQKLEEKRVTT